MSGSHAGSRRTPRHHAGRQTTEFSLLFGNGRSRFDTVEAPPPPVAAADPPSIARHEPDAADARAAGTPGRPRGRRRWYATQDPASTLRCVAVNVNGLRDKQKRCVFFDWMMKQKLTLSF